jgi:hypothetical protein
VRTECIILYLYFIYGCLLFTLRWMKGLASVSVKFVCLFIRLIWLVSGPWASAVGFSEQVLAAGLHRIVQCLKDRFVTKYILRNPK